MFEKKFVRPRLCFIRSERLSDVKLVCEDGVANAHQFVLERHSPFLKKFFVSQSTLVGVTLNHPRVMGLPSTLKERREPSPMVQIHLPNYTLLTVNLLLDLLYTGKTSQLGDLDESMGQLNIRLLYKDLGMDPESGGLPDIAELDTVEMDGVKKTSKTAKIDEIIVEDVKEVPLIEAATSTTVDLEESPAVNNSEVVGLSRGHVETLAVSDSENTLQETEVDTVDVNDLLSDEEIELEDDYETSKIRNEAFDTKDSQVQENTKYLKEFSKIKLGTKENKENQSDQGMKDIQSYDWELEMLDTSVEFEKVENEKLSGVTSKGRRRSVNLVKKSQLQLAENEYEHSRGDEKKNDHKNMKDQAKLAVFREKKRKYQASSSSLSPLESRKSETVKTRRIHSAEQDQEDLSIESNIEIMNSTTEKNEIKSTESIANCFKKLCSAKLEEVDFSITAVSTDLIKSKVEEPSAPITLHNKYAKINNPTSLSNANKKRKTENMKHHIAEEFVCPIQGCSFKHIMTYSSAMKRIYRILKHLVSHHLRKKPCKIYEDLDGMFCSNKELTCSSCTYTSKSKTSLLTHMAYEHGDLFKRLKKFQKKARTKEEVDIYVSIDDYLKKEWENWRARVPSSCSTTPKCSVNLTVKDCNPCDEMYPNWNELRTHVLTKHCLDKLDLYISGSKEEGYECEATYCTFKVKDKIDILNHLASKDHSIISDKEIVDIALGVHRVNGLNSTCKDSTGSDSIKPISVNTDESLETASRIYKTGESSNMLRSCKKQIVGVKMDRKENDIDMVCDDIKPESVESEAEVVVLKSLRDIKNGVEMVAPKLSSEEQVARKRKFRNESFEVFGPPLQILKDPPVIVNKSLHKSNPPSGSIEMETLSVEVTAEVTSGNEERATLGNENITTKYQCKFCVYNYVSDDNLREHVLSEHRNKFKTIPLLEGGQKFYECDFCSKRTKVRSFHLRHLKNQHKVLPLELVESVEEWKTGILSFLDFCSPQDDDGFGYLSQHSSKESNVEDSSSSKLQARLDKSPVRSPENKNIVHVPAELDEEDAPTELNADDAVIETINDFISKLDNESKETSQEISGTEIPGTEIPVTHSDEAKHDNNIKVVNSIDECSDDEVIEEFVSITKRKPLKPKLRQKMPTEFVCQVCDKIFSSGAKVSAHVFMIHLQRMSDNVWQELYRESEGTSGNICLICEEMHERRTHAKLHQYSNHKRELKKKMEEKGQDWRNLLDYIQYKVTADMINEEDLTESSEVESRHGSIPEVYNNPFYLECTSPVVTNSIPSCQTSIPVNQKHDKEAKKEYMPPNTVAQVESNVVETKESKEDERKESTENETKEPGVNNVMVRNIQDVSDSDDGVQVMTSRNDHSKKLSEVDSIAEKGKVKDIEVPEPLPLKSKLPCPFPKCDEMFPDLPGLVDHYLETHPQSPLKLPIISSLAPERIKRKGDMVTVSISGEDKVLLPCQHCEAQFTELSLLTRHVNRHKDSAAVQCDHCRNFVKVEEKQQHQLVCLHKGELEKIRILKAPLSPLAIPRIKLHQCTHKQVGCAEVFTEKKDLHDHARKCRFRPKTNFSCQHTGCKKRYYYKADYDRHVAKFHATTSGPATTG